MGYGTKRHWKDLSWCTLSWHDDVIKWKHLPRNWPFVRGIHRSPLNSPHKGQWREALMFSLICAWINTWLNNRETGDFKRYSAHYNVIVMVKWYATSSPVSVRGPVTTAFSCHDITMIIPSHVFQGPRFTSMTAPWLSWAGLSPIWRTTRYATCAG